MKKFVLPFVIAIFGFLLTLGALKIFEIPSNYLSYERIVEKVERNNQNLYFEFLEDYKDKENMIPNKYSFTEYDGVKADYVEDNIKVGDLIKVTIEDNNGAFTYKLLQKVEKNGNVIFDSIEHYQNHNMNLRFIFIPFIIVISLFLIIMCYIDFEKNNTISLFVIRFPKWVTSFFIFSILLGSVIPLMFTILLLVGNLSFDTYQFSYIFYLFLILGVFGLLKVLLTGIKYDSNNYYIFRMFRKTKKIDKNEIGKILFDRTGNRKSKSGLYDKKNQKIIDYSFELNYYLSKEYFINSLRKDGVKFVELVLDKKGKEKENEIMFL